MMRLLLVPMLIGLIASPAASQEKKKVEPRVIVALPLGVQAGATHKIVLRGLGLEGAKEVRFAAEGVSGKILGSGKASVPDKNPERVGDTQVTVEVKIDAAVKENVALTLILPEGETKPHTLLVEDRPVVQEKEPNEGFAKPSVIEKTPMVIEGSIERPRDVDVFAIKGTKGQTLRAEVIAARQGSALDPQIAIFRSGSIQLIAPTKSIKGDVAVEVILPADDTYFLVVTDALDTGSNVHVYRLVVELR